MREISSWEYTIFHYSMSAGNVIVIPVYVGCVASHINVWRMELLSYEICDTYIHVHDYDVQWNLSIRTHLN